MKRLLGVLATAALLVPATQTQAAVEPDCLRFTALALEVGWQKREIPRLMQICKRESKGFARAWNQRDPYTGIRPHADKRQQQTVSCRVWHCA